MPVTSPTTLLLAHDVLNLTAIFSVDRLLPEPTVMDGYLSFAPDGAGNTAGLCQTRHGAPNPWADLVTTLDHVNPDQHFTSHDYIFPLPIAAQTNCVGDTGMGEPHSGER